jgi:hypothetical protein
MARRNADAPLAVETPPAGADRPSWGRVGIITAIGFAVGVIWPRMAGVRLGPSVPDAPSAVTAASASAAVAPPVAAVPAASPLPAAAAVAPAPPQPVAVSPPTTVEVSGGVVFSCKSADGATRKGADCGDLPGLDGVVTPRLRKVARCPEAAGASGKLHLVVRPDFARESLGVELGRGQTVGAPEALLGCAKTALADAKLSGITHQNARYGVAYALTFAFESAPPAAPPPPAEAPAPSREAGGSEDATAQVTWEVALVRDAPKTGKVLARLQRGTSLHVGSAKDGWYPVKYGDGFASDGWVYRGAIGR